MRNRKIFFRILSMILTVTVLCASLPLLVFADQIEWEENTENEQANNRTASAPLSNEQKYALHTRAGLESHFPILSQSVVAGHTGCLDLNSGELTYIMPLISTTDSLLPYTVSLVYNSIISGQQRNNTTTLNAYDQSYAPNGTKLNICETIYGLYNENSVLNYFYEDSDGTTHRFVPNKGIFTEDEGLQLKILFQNGNLILSDVEGNQKLFTPFGTRKFKLEEITDKYGNKVKFTFNDSLPVSVSLIPNGGTAVEMLKLEYNADGLVSMVYNPVTLDAAILRYDASRGIQSLDYVKCGDNATLENLRQYVNNEALNTSILQIAKVNFVFDTNGRLNSSFDTVSGKGISYLYQNDSTLRISEVGEEIGQTTDITFRNGYTEIRASGKDDALGNNDDIITRYVFDTAGRIKNTYSTSLDGKEVYGATLGEYQADDSIAKNKIKTTTTIGGSPVNLIYNGGFELYSSSNGSAWFNGWYKYGNVAKGNETPELVDNGMHCAFFGPEADAPAGIYQGVVLSAGDYTLSFDIDFVAMEKVYGTVRIYSADDTCIHEADIPRNTTLNGGTYGKFSTGFTVSSPVSDSYVIDIQFEKYGEHTVYEERLCINNVVLEAGNGSSEYSFVTFGGFEETSDYFTIDDVWEGNYYVDSVADGFGDALVLTGNGEDTSYAEQRILGATPMSPANSTYIFNYIVSGFVKVNGGITADSNPRIRIDAYYRKQSGSNEAVVKSFYFDFLEGVDGWQFFAERFSAGVDTVDGVVYNELMYMNIVCEYTGPAGGIAYFDNVSVVLDEGTTAEEYSYYPSDHVNAGQLMTYNYYEYYEYYLYDDQNRISAFANSKGEMTEYVYDGLGILKFEILSDYSSAVDTSTHFPLLYFLEGSYTLDELINRTPKSITEYTYDAYGLSTSVAVYSNITNVASDGATAIGTSGYYTTESTQRLAAEYTYIYGTVTAPSRIFGAIETESRDEVYNARYFYDPNDGKLLATVNVGTGSGTVNEYDEYDRLVNVYPASYSATSEAYTAVTNAESVTYSYDALHRLSSISTESTVYSFEYDSFDNRTSVSVGDNEIVSYEYNDYNGKLKRVIYANGLIAEYEYNDIDLLSEIWYTVNGVKALVYSYAYNADGNLYSVTDEINGRGTVYSYDGRGRLLGSIQYSESDMEIDFSTIIAYYGRNGLVYSNDAYLNYHVDGSPYEVSSGLVYYYNPDETLNYTAINFPRSSGRIYYTYDEFDRISSISADYKQGTTVKVQRDENYTYRTYGDNETDGLVSRYESSINGVKKTYIYTYDKRGYILTEYIAGKEYTYTYDDLGQLIQVYDGTNTYVYVYDNSGNITELKKKLPLLDGGGGGGDMIERGIPPRYETLKTYGYTNSEWGDLLTSFNGSTITYDTLGNPLTYYDGTSFSWQGRQLVGAVNGAKTMSFSYDDNGLRTTKTVNGVTTEYYWNGNLLAAERTPSYVIIYNYDASGRPIGMAYRESTYIEGWWNVYWFDLNLHGDVVAIYDTDGVKMVTYSYDAWGKCTASYYNGGANTGADKNNLRYRGYYYDTDLGFYYLQSRYYDANTYRFISPDGYISTGQGILGYNMYAYCGNNPVNCVDPTGEAWWYWLCYAISPVVTTALATANDIYQITRNDGNGITVSAGSNGDSVQIKNSNKILTPLIQTAIAIHTDYIKPETKDLVNGSVYGVVFEWTVHNLAYDALTFFGVKGSLVESAAHVDIGSTIYDDNAHKSASTAMHVFYTASIIFNPKSVVFDIVTHLFRRK